METDPEAKASIGVQGMLRFPLNRIEEAEARLKPILERFRRHEGCIMYNLARDIIEPDVLRQSELFLDHRTLDLHVANPDVIDWRKVHKDCGLLEQRYVVTDIATVTIVLS